MNADYLLAVGYNHPTSLGVYAILNTHTNQAYVGSTKDLTRRSAQHFGALIEGVHHNRNLQFSFDTSGASSFTFIVLEYLTDVEGLEAREQIWLNRLKKVLPIFNIQQRVKRDDTWEDWKPVDNVTLPWEEE